MEVENNLRSLEAGTWTMPRVATLSRVRNSGTENDGERNSLEEGGCWN